MFRMTRTHPANPLNVQPSGLPPLHHLFEQRMRWKTWAEIGQNFGDMSAGHTELTTSCYSVAIGHNALSHMTQGYLNFCIGPAVGSALLQAVGQLVIALPQRRLLIADLVQEYAQFITYSDEAAFVAESVRQLVATASSSSLHSGSKLPERGVPLHTLQLGRHLAKPSRQRSPPMELTESLFDGPMWTWLSNIWNETWDTLPVGDSFNIMLNRQFFHPAFTGNFNLFYGATVGSDVIAADGLVIIELPEARLFIADLVAETAEFMAYSDEAAMVAPQYREPLS